MNISAHASKSPKSSLDKKFNRWQAYQQIRTKNHKASPLEHFSLLIFLRFYGVYAYDTLMNFFSSSIFQENKWAGEVQAA